MSIKCPFCGRSALVEETRDLSYSYKGEETVLTSVMGEFCAFCGEGIFDAAESARPSAMMLELNKQVNASFVDAEFISNVRKKLALDQREAAELFEGGVNAFPRYENGRTKPPVALVKLLKILDRHPDLLAEVRQG